MTKYFYYGMNVHGNRLNLKRKYSSAYRYDCDNHTIEPIIEIGDNCYTWDLIICAIRGCKQEKLEAMDLLNMEGESSDNPDADEKEYQD